MRGTGWTLVWHMLQEVACPHLGAVGGSGGGGYGCEGLTGVLGGGGHIVCGLETTSAAIR